MTLLFIFGSFSSFVMMGIEFEASQMLGQLCGPGPATPSASLLGLSALSFQSVMMFLPFLLSAFQWDILEQQGDRDVPLCVL